MISTSSKALSAYADAFTSPQEPFLFYYSLDEDKNVTTHSYSRGEFLSLARKAVSVIRNADCHKGDRVLHCFSANTPEDLAFRLAAAMTGVIPVTVNWQADSIERILYKLELTEAKLVLCSRYFNPDFLTMIHETRTVLPMFHIEDLCHQEEAPEELISPDVDHSHTKIIIFTSGTTGNPKGVQLPYRSYLSNRDCFEQLLNIGEDDTFAVYIVNPLHHTNSTAITDWAMRRPHSHIHLFEKYTTNYWQSLVEIVDRGYDRVVAPTVSRHFDFLENLCETGALPVALETLQPAMAKTDFLIGSAPVGPTTIRRLQKYAGRIPTVRFGSTETCLQVLGIPHHLGEEEKLAIFERGWEFEYDGNKAAGFYIGRPHPPFNEVRIVKSISNSDAEFMQDCPAGVPGYLITRGGNVMSAYVNNPKATRDVLVDGWYLGLKDICFCLENSNDGKLDYYWLSRDSNMMIRGGANYAYAQINAELTAFTVDYYKLPQEAFEVSVVGLKADSEHEDCCCVTLELKSDDAKARRKELEETFTEAAGKQVSKGAKPDYLRIAEIPKNFKGAIQVPKLVEAFERYVKGLSH